MKKKKRCYDKRRPSLVALRALRKLPHLAAMENSEGVLLRMARKIRVRRNGCLEWVGGASSGRYGTFIANKIIYRMNRLVVNPKPGMLALHECDNSMCVNPKHLYEGTQADNVHDCVRRGRAGPTRSQILATHVGKNHYTNRHPELRMRGEKNGQAKITEDDVREIRRLIDSGLSSRITSRKFGLSQSVAHGIGARKSWRHVK